MADDPLGGVGSFSELFPVIPANDDDRILGHLEAGYGLLLCS